MGAGAQGCLVHAGILNGDETLTEIAKDIFIKDVKNELLFGTEGVASLFPCGPVLQANPFAEQLDLENEEKFPDFHKNIIKNQYEKVAGQLNLAGGFMILPICDPFALGFALGIDMKIKIPKFPEGFIDFLIPNLPKLALDLELMPPIKLAAKLPGLIQIPSIPNFEIPKLPNPALDFVPGLNFDLQFALKLPIVILNVIAKLPSLLLELPNLPSAICKIVFESNLFEIRPDSGIKIAAYKVLTKKVTEMILLTAIGKVVGSSPVGIVGGFGAMFGYKTISESGDFTNDIRGKIMSYAESCVDLNYGDRTKRDEYAQRLFYTEYGDGQPRNNLPKNDPLYDKRVIGKEKTLIKASELSSCGLFVRACLFAGGARYTFKYSHDQKINTKNGRYYDFFVDEYRLINGGGVVISTLINAAKAKNAYIPPPKNDLLELKQGDLIIVYDSKFANREHVLLVAEDYNSGTYELITIEGGQIDESNSNKPTAITKKIYKNPKFATHEFKNKKNQLESPSSFTIQKNGTILLSGRRILCIIDSEIFCESMIGANSTNPTKTIEHDIFDNNDPYSDFQSGLIPKEG